MVKGIADPMRTYLVLRTKPRAFHATTRVVEGIETRMVGREAEFAKLTDTFEAVVVQGTLALVTVVADAGLGKSRLMFEFEHWLDLRPKAVGMFHGRAQPYSNNVPYGLLRDLLAWLLRDPRQRHAGSRPSQAGQRLRYLVWRPYPGADSADRSVDRTGLQRQPTYLRYRRRRQADPRPLVPRRGAIFPSAPPGR